MSIIVIGAGQAGLQLADSLRRGGYEGELRLFGAESTPPYQRPPLSKQYMTGDLAEERLLFRPLDYYTKQNIELSTDAPVGAINVADKTITVGATDTFSYDKLALTTGATVRKIPIPGADSRCVFYLRSVEDARQIREKLSSGRQRVVTIGGGFIGLELAAAAAEMAHEVTVVEALDRLMARAVSPLISEHYADYHRDKGVDVRLETAVSAIRDQDDGSCQVSLGNGDEITADIVVVGIGSVPHTELAEAAGLTCDNGIVVDEYALTSNPDIVAAGDCTMHRNVGIDVVHRLESVQNAVDQAKVAAATLLGDEKSYAQVPWFWSDQFDLKLQMVGSSVDFDRYVIRGSRDENAFSVFYFRGDKLTGIDSVNRPADHLVGRKLIAAGVNVPDNMISDTEQNLKSLL